MKDSRDINDLHPIVAAKCRGLIAECAKQGIEVLITSTLRDNERQAQLYAKGRTAPGKIVTYAKPGDSWHNHGLAFDFYPRKVGTKGSWNDLALFRKVRAIGVKQFGLEGLSFELAHLQYRGGLSLREAKAGKRPAA
jgi:peptidoglycan L-alanyl-D-glutamate endopeptidase CwlK